MFLDSSLKMKKYKKYYKVDEKNNNNIFPFLIFPPFPFN